MRLGQLGVSLLAGMVLTASAFAQPGPGPGNGRGYGFSQGNTFGWSLMSPEERAAHQRKMRSAQTYDECKSIQAENHKAMAERAKEQGKTLPAPRANACDRMKARGFFK